MNYIDTYFSSPTSGSRAGWGGEGGSLNLCDPVTVIQRRVCVLVENLPPSLNAVAISLTFKIGAAFWQRGKRYIYHSVL